MSNKDLVIFGFKPHDLYSYHPMYANWGLFFNKEKKFNLAGSQSLNEYVLTNKIKCFSDIRDLNNYFQLLNSGSTYKEIDIFILGKYEYTTKKKVEYLNQTIAECKILNNLKINVIGDTNKWKYFYDKIEFYKFLKKNKLEYYAEYNVLKLEDISSISEIKLTYPVLLKEAKASGGNDSYLINSVKELIIKVSQIKRQFISNKIFNKKWFIVEFIDTRDQFGFYLSYRVFGLHNIPYFIYPNVSHHNPITHVSENDKITIDEYSKALNECTHIFNVNYKLFKQIFKLLNNPFSALDFLVDNNGEIVFSECELKYGPSQKYISNQIYHYNLDEDHFEKIRKDIKSQFYTFDDIFLNYHENYEHV